MEFVYDRYWFADLVWNAKHWQWEDKDPEKTERKYKAYLRSIGK